MQQQHHNSAAAAWLVLLGASTGVVVGLAVAAAHVVRQEYFSQGLPVNAVLASRGVVLWGGGLGAGCGLLLGIARHLRLRRRVRQPADQGPARRLWVATAWAAATLSGLLIARSIVVGALSTAVVIGASGAVLAWLGVWRVLMHHKTRDTDAVGSQGNAIEAVLYSTLACFAVVASFLEFSQFRHLSVIAISIVAVVLAASVASPLHGVSWRSGGRVCWTALAIVGFGVPAVVWSAIPMWVSHGPPPQRARNVILIGIDTLRHDCVDLETGGSRTPHLQQLAARGTVFTNAVSQAPWTMPAFASIMTGKYPHEHGALSLYGALRERELTLAEVLRERGFETSAVVSHLYVDRKHGFGQGFNWFNEDHSLGHNAVTSIGVTDTAIARLKQQTERPFFMFVHYFDPHSEYHDHQEWSQADFYNGWLAGEQNDLRNLRRKRHMLGAQDVAYIRDLYDEEIAHTDAQIGRLLEYLEVSGLSEDTVIILTSDHGEEIMDRGWIGHTNSLYEELIHVGLVIADPHVKSRVPVVERTVETRTLFHTILELAGLGHAGETDDDSLAGLLEAPAVRLAAASDHLADDGAAFSCVWLPDAKIDSGKRVKLLSMRTQRWKVIRDCLKDHTAMFDLQVDPAEHSDVSDAHPERLQSMLRRIDDWWGGACHDPEDVPTRMPNGRDLERLRSLGYVQ